MILSAEGVTIGYKSPRRPPVVVAEGITLSLGAGEMVCLLGPNGAGKSTLMRTLAGMQPPLAGQVRLMGDDPRRLKPAELARRLSLVLTDKVDVGNITAYALVALGRHPHTDWIGTLSETDKEVIAWALDCVDGAGLAHKSLHHLSDGERQKIMIARALAQQPALMMLDEPTAYLDLPRRVEIMATLRRIARETGRAVLLSTHDLDLALRSADRLWLLPKGGHLQIGAPEDLVLNGAFEAAFASEGLQFDRHTGTFKLPTSQRGRVQVVGEGLSAVWTVRALQREGFIVTDEEAEMCVEVREGENPGWVVRQEGQHLEASSIHRLIECLR